MVGKHRMLSTHLLMPLPLGSNTTYLEEMNDTGFSALKEKDKYVRGLHASVTLIPKKQIQHFKVDRSHCL